ncbi:hypothetical protein EMCRGX_G016573 [Ephydatia muelleri]
MHYPNLAGIVLCVDLNTKEAAISSTHMASTNTRDVVTPGHSGYDKMFLYPLLKRHECPICLLAMRDPVQTECGHLFCRGCLEPVLSKDTPLCPLDNASLNKDDVFPDNACRREILTLEVKCDFAASGCSWIGQLNDLQNPSGKPSIRGNLVSRAIFSLQSPEPYPVSRAISSLQIHIQSPEPSYPVSRAISSLQSHIQSPEPYPVSRVQSHIQSPEPYPVSRVQSHIQSPEPYPVSRKSRANPVSRATTKKSVSDHHPNTIQSPESESYPVSRAIFSLPEPYPVFRAISISRVQSHIQSSEPYPVSRSISSLQSHIQSTNIQSPARVISSLQSHIQSQSPEPYPVSRAISSLQSHIQSPEPYSVSRVQSHIQSPDPYPVSRAISSLQIHIQSPEPYPESRAKPVSNQTISSLPEPYPVSGNQSQTISVSRAIFSLKPYPVSRAISSLQDHIQSPEPYPVSRVQSHIQSPEPYPVSRAISTPEPYPVSRAISSPELLSPGPVYQSHIQSPESRAISSLQSHISLQSLKYTRPIVQAISSYRAYPVSRPYPVSRATSLQTTIQSPEPQSSRAISSLQSHIQSSEPYQSPEPYSVSRVQSISSLQAAHQTSLRAESDIRAYQFQSKVTQQCGLNVPVWSLTTHREEECPMRTAQCEYCGKAVPVEQTEDHLLRVCEEYIHQCPNKCDPNLNLKLSQLEAHLDPKSGDCPLAEVPCPFKQFGCTFVVCLASGNEVMGRGRQAGDMPYVVKFSG